jgi:hypothetical protein
MSHRHDSAVGVGAGIAASDDPVVCRKFFDVLNLLSPPSSLMSPAVILRVLARRAPQGAGTPWGVFTPPQPASQV